ncbi:GAF domain-containing protein [Fulvimarina endophytica]|uniref:GAF domain-containing protein n=2 Tax=Fulvimarina endophytica TaxID=2293836 RepID=A0A371WXU3_9HYPH|nr:GAF domain-containing protein [Fulvimarina endophytica]
MLCDREPIHIPGAIQPHGVMLVADAETSLIVGVAGDVENRLTSNWSGRALSEVLGQPVDTSEIVAGSVLELDPLIGQTETFDVALHRSGEWLVAELEPAESDQPIKLSILKAASHGFERSSNLNHLYKNAAAVFRKLTGYDRVMVYRFLEDNAGVVVGESDAEGVGSFMNHHFPAADIPKQARALYIRNRIRVIPNVAYAPAPIRSSASDLAEIDLSDAALRSVSPIHLQYLANMDVAASASVSIVQDGTLWGLVACHNRTPRPLSRSVRDACEILALQLSRQIRAKDEAVLYRERVRLRSSEDDICGKLGPDDTLGKFFKQTGRELRRMMASDGFAAFQGGDVFTEGTCPDPMMIQAIARFAMQSIPQRPVSTDRLSTDLPEAASIREIASGLLAVVMSSEVPTVLLWFRAEKLQVVEWAGNPHKNVDADPNAVLTPRSSFENWTETVRGRSRPWSLAEVESAGRIIQRLLEERANRRMKLLNEELAVTIRENDRLIRQKDFLLKEVNHRVQNSLSLVNSFLRMQAREAAGSEAVAHLTVAQQRIGAVSLVHRRLYSGTSVDNVDLGRYLEELVEELVATLDEGWRDQITLDLVPVLISADKAVPVGLILTELVINANKYAYEGAAGPIAVSLEQHHNQFRMVVADQGAGKGNEVKGTGFGSRMLDVLLNQIDGALESADNHPGLRTIVTAPVAQTGY